MHGMQELHGSRPENRPLDQLSKSDLSRCHAAVSRRLAAATLSTYLVRQGLEKRLGEMDEAGKVTIFIPDPELPVGYREVQAVHASLETVLKTVTERGTIGIGLALEDWDRARKWADRHGVFEDLREALHQLQSAIRKRTEQLREWQGGEPVEEERWSSPPPPLEARPDGGERLTVGVDLVLEMCTGQLADESAEVRRSVEAFIQHAPEATEGWLRWFVGTYVL